MDDEKIEALDELMRATVALFHRLRRAAEEAHDRGEPTAGERGLLRQLDEEGARTVPEMARARLVSRQHVQVLVNGLLDAGLVELADNPAHKRSKLVRLTVKGRARVRAMAARERELLGELPLAPSPAALRRAARVLGATRAAFESERWRSLLEGG